MLSSLRPPFCGMLGRSILNGLCFSSSYSASKSYSRATASTTAQSITAVDDRPGTQPPWSSAFRRCPSPFCCAHIARLSQRRRRRAVHESLLRHAVAWLHIRIREHGVQHQHRRRHHKGGLYRVTMKHRPRPSDRHLLRRIRWDSRCDTRARMIPAGARSSAPHSAIETRPQRGIVWGQRIVSGRQQQRRRRRTSCRR